MAYNPKKNTINFSDNSNLNKGMGQLYIHTLKAVAETPGAPEFSIKEWVTIKDWLECKDGNLTDYHLNIIGLAWQSYLARGISPSIELDQNFKETAKQAKQEKWEIVEVPDEVEDVFDRMLATDKEIHDKRMLELKRAANSMQSLSSKTNPSRLKHKSFSKNKKVMIVFGCMWFLYAVFRMNDSYEIFGLYLEKWNDNAFLINAFGPIIGVIGASYIYKWVQKN